MSIQMNAITIGAALVALYWGLAILMRSMGSDMPYPTELIGYGWRNWL